MARPASLLFIPKSHSPSTVRPGESRDPFRLQMAGSVPDATLDLGETTTDARRISPTFLDPARHLQPKWVPAFAGTNGFEINGRRRSIAGFTLLEVLVAMVVLGLMMAGLTQGVRLGIRSVNRQAQSLDERADMDGVDRVLRDLITHIEPGGGRTPVQIEGDQEHFHFISRLPSAVALLTRRADMTLVVDDDHRLVLRWRPALHETSFEDPPEPTDTPLLDKVDKIEFAYWAPDDGSNQPAGWRDEWNSPYLPFVVRLKITFPDGDKRHFPTILVAPLLEQPGG